MSYTLISANYEPAVGGTGVVQGIKGNRVPCNTIKGGNGSFVVRTDFIPAEFELCFEDSNGKKYVYNAYGKIKSSMSTQRLTEKRRQQITAEVAKISATSSVYEPEEWVEKAVKNLNI